MATKKVKKLTNAENIKKMSVEELGDYIYSVFLTGMYYGQTDKPIDGAPDYVTWLNSEVEEIDLGNFDLSEFSSVLSLKEE